MSTEILTFLIVWLDLLALTVWAAQLSAGRKRDTEPYYVNKVDPLTVSFVPMPSANELLAWLGTDVADGTVWAETYMREQAFRRREP